MSKTLIYLDPGYDVTFGHYDRMRELISEESVKQNIELKHYVNLEVPEETAEEFGLIRRFKYKAGLQWIADPVEALYDFYLRLDEILFEINKRPEETAIEVLMYTAHPLHLPIVAFLINKYSSIIIKLTSDICIFYLNTDFCRGEEGLDYYKSILIHVSELIELFDPGHMLSICTDSDRTKTLYSPYFKREIKTLSFPIEKDIPVDLRERTVKHNKIVIGYIGQTTKRAGYDFTYNIYKKMTELVIFNKIEFKIKHTPRNYLKDIYEQFTSEILNITHINRFLSKEEIDIFYSECDIIILPYSIKHYPCESSGIFVEALLRNKILIVPEDTWMSDQLNNYGAGETFVSDDLESATQALDKVVNNFDFYKARTNRNLDDFRNIHSCLNLFAEIGLKEPVLKTQNKTSATDELSGINISEKLMIKNTLFLEELELKSVELKKSVGQINHLREKMDNLEKTHLAETRKLSGKLEVAIEKHTKELSEVSESLKKISSEKAALQAQAERLDRNIHEIKNSYSWKVTAPLRWILRQVK